MKGLNGKRVLISGGAGAIGTATAKRFVEEGAHVYVFDRDEAACQRLKKDMPHLAGDILVDVADPDSVARAFDELDKRAGGPDILINNAGISIRHAFLDITPQDWRTVLDINLNGVFYVAQQSARRMLAQGGGGIVQRADGLSLLRRLQRQ
jgi:meso-butanediol dehydrogenase/(S,S)-butanediol dehydrogenase/diacetyl reductase